MTVRNQCLAEVDLVDYLYDEVDTQDAAVIAAHVATCATCADDLKALQTTREGLQAWTPPDVADGFVRTLAAIPPSPEVLRPARWWRQPLPAWAQVAAAAALFSAGVGLGALRATSVGPATRASATPGIGTTAPSAATPVSAGDLAALEARLRAEMRTSASPRAVASRQSDEALLQQVRTMITESERRQQQELTLRTAELVRDVDAQRRGDLARIERTFGQMEGTTGVQVEQQRQLLNYLMRVSQRQPQ